METDFWMKYQTIIDKQNISHKAKDLIEMGKLISPRSLVQPVGIT